MDNLENQKHDPATDARTEDAGRLYSGLTVTLPLMAKCWGYVCYALYSVMGEVARANGKTFKEVAQNNDEWGSVASLFRRLTFAPLLGIDPAAVMPVISGQKEPPPLVDIQTREGFESWEDFNDYLIDCENPPPIIANMQARIDALEAVNEELKAENKELNGKVKRYDTAYKIALGELKDVRKENNELDRKLNIMRNERGGYEIQIKEWYIPHLQEADATIERLQAEIDQLKSPPQEARGASNEANNHSEPNEEEE